MADLDFACAIRKAPVFLLVAMHLPEVEALSQEDALKKLVPASAKKTCAFYRIWVRLKLSQIRTPALGHILKPCVDLGVTTMLSVCSASSN